MGITKYSHVSTCPLSILLLPMSMSPVEWSVLYGDNPEIHLRKLCCSRGIFQMYTTQFLRQWPVYVGNRSYLAYMNLWMGAVGDWQIDVNNKIFSCQHLSSLYPPAAKKQVHLSLCLSSGIISALWWSVLVLRLDRWVGITARLNIL